MSVTREAVICGSGGVPIQLQFGSYSAGILRGFGRVLVNRRRHGGLEKDVRSSPTFKRPARTLRISPGSASRRDASRRDLIDPSMSYDQTNTNVYTLPLHDRAAPGQV